VELKKIKNALANEPNYRFNQAKKAVYSELIDDWNEVKVLPKNLIEKLSRDCPINNLFKEEMVLFSRDRQTAKAVFTLEDGAKIESVLMKHSDGRRTVCVSSQAGCAMACAFCATGQQGFIRNLNPDEIVNQVLFFARLNKKNSERVSNVVFMGMGEPFLNYDNVLEAVKILNDKNGLNIGIRRISISTIGILEGIKKLSQEPLQVNLAVSLHAPDNELRSELMPANKKYPIEKILSAVDDYISKTKRKVMFEYLIIDGKNDKPEQAQKLAKIMKKPLYMVNIISFNPAGHCKFNPSSGWKIKNFKDILEKAGVNVTQRYRFGKEIKGACGQLAGEQN
jgi:23S rRNA (adenine2503-C2)-methyltransferase